MKNLLLVLSLSICFNAFSIQTDPTIAIIPEPVSVKQGAGHLRLPQQVTVQTNATKELSQPINDLKKRLADAAGIKTTVVSSAPNANIQLVLNERADPKIRKDGYHLTVNTRNVIIHANEPAGMFYGVQSLLQLMPAAIESKGLVQNVQWNIPVVEINDYPRFGWRGLMLDVARHFFTKQEVKNFIDNMARYKFNVLHLHLSDDEGWRLEIKGLPRLTEVGAWNVKKQGYFGTFTPPGKDEPRNYGGFYTQDDIRELVKYAKERFIDILPEIDVPGHSLAAIVSYPELSCTPEANTYVVRSGEQIMDWSRGAPPIALVDNTLCPANEKVYTFLDKIITQMAELFPFEYMHMGGDETPKNYWEKMPEIKSLMQREGLKDMHEVQSYFTKRVEKIVSSKGKKFIGWDEILEGGLAPGAAVMSWRGMKGGIEAAKMNHEVVMSPTTHAYLDYMQGDIAMEPRVYASLRLSKAYEFDPMPEGVDPKYIKGGQGNLWTEQIQNTRALEYMLWPRAFAVAESVWSLPSKKNWPNFFSRVEKHFERFDAAEIKYAPSVYEPSIDVSYTGNKQLKITLATETPVNIHYSFDNSFPDKFYPVYKEPLIAPVDAAMLKIVTYKNNKPVGRMMVVQIADLKARADKKK
jgi:hexosaminidase